MEKPSILVVNQNQEELAILSGIARRSLANWNIQTADSEHEAYEQIDAWQERIRAAIVDLSFDRTNSQDSSGVRVLRQLHSIEPDCFRILTEMRARHIIMKIYEACTQSEPRLADKVISLRYIDTDPVEELKSALLKAGQRCEV